MRVSAKQLEWKSNAEQRKTQWLIKVSHMKRYFKSHLFSDSSVPRVLYQSRFTHSNKQTIELQDSAFSQRIVLLVNYHSMPGQYAFLRDRKSALVLRRAHCCALFRQWKLQQLRGWQWMWRLGPMGAGVGDYTVLAQSYRARISSLPE